VEICDRGNPLNDSLPHRAPHDKETGKIMGLDMYLRYRQSHSGYSYGDNDTTGYDNLVAAAGLTEIASKTSPYASVEVTVMYWRKVNAIHGWFVNELAGGVDECQEIHVTRENLQTLRDLCFEALSIPAGMSLADHAVRVLPPSEGFFFGSTEVDEYYIQDLQETMDGLDRILSHLPTENEGWDWSLIYQASW
jgi:hypothetical protein